MYHFFNIKEMNFAHTLCLRAWYVITITYINWLVFVMDTQNVYCEVGTEIYVMWT